MTPTWKLRGYVVESPLGHGGSGDVWRARVAGSGERVALKRIPTADSPAAERARAEAALLCVLDHPNLMRLHALVPTSNAAVLVLDLADGGSLADLLAARGRLAVGEVITAVAPIAAALAYLHQRGVVHGDVSAANIVLTCDGVPVLADLGVARLTAAAGSFRNEDETAATLAYVDPCVAAGCVPGPSSDVFALAGVALHALTGEPPWPAETPAEALERAARGVLTDVAAKLSGAGAPPGMAAVITRALSLDADRRGTAADFALELGCSARATAVELAAGRARPALQHRARTGPRHAAPVPIRERVSARSMRSGGAGEAGRPAFERPSSEAAQLGVGGDRGAPPTRMVRPRPRPALPGGSRFALVHPRSVRRHGLRVGITAAAVAGVLALATTLVSGGVGSAHPEARRRAVSPPNSAASASAGAAEAAASGSAIASPTAAAVLSGGLRMRARAALVELDARRGEAFARRDVTVLARVYPAGPLRAADTALLTRIVPPGCALRGVHTDYDLIKASAGAGGRIVVSATASLTPSRLMCAGRERGRAPGSPPTALHVELAPISGTLLIAAQHPE